MTIALHGQESTLRNTARHIIHMRAIMLDGAHAIYHDDVVAAAIIEAHYRRHAAHIASTNGWNRRRTIRVLTKHTLDYAKRHVTRYGACPDEPHTDATITPLKPAGGR